MKSSVNLLLAVLAVGLCPVGGSALADTLDYGRYAVVVTVPGTGGPGLDANGQVMERVRRILGQAAYDRDYTVGDYLAVHDRQARRLNRMQLEYRSGDVRFTSDGRSEADLVFPLTGAVMEVLLPVPGPGRLLGRVACPCCGREWPEGRAVPEGVELVPFEDAGMPAFTGVLVDVRGLGFRPALFPRVVTASGKEVYGPAFADEDPVVADGLAGFYQTHNQALLDGRVGSNPLVVRATATEGRHRCDAVVSDPDATRMHGTQRILDKLARCRVGFLTD